MSISIYTKDELIVLTDFIKHKCDLIKALNIDGIVEVSAATYINVFYDIGIKITHKERFNVAAIPFFDVNNRNLLNKDIAIKHNKWLKDVLDIIIVSDYNTIITDYNRMNDIEVTEINFYLISDKVNEIMRIHNLKELLK